MRLNNTQKLQKLKRYFNKRNDVIMAFVFGSRAKRLSHSGSDWDIAVYFKPEVAKVEWEEHNREYPEEDKVWGDCIDILQTDNVDLVVLNRAPASIANTAIHGIPLVIKDRRLLIEFMLIVTREADDFMKTTEEYAQIYWRSKSLTKEDAHALYKRLTFLETELRALSEYSSMTWNEYDKISDKRRQVERCIENLMNAVIDISKIILASSKRPVPSTYREIVRQISTFIPLSTKIAEKLSSWTELRNILAHEYLDITWKSISDFLQNSEPYFKQFIESAKKLLDKEASSKN